MKEFIERLGEGRSVTYVGIVPDGPTNAATFNGADVQAACAWLKAQNAAGRGVYFTLSPTGPSLAKKPKKSDLIGLAGLHADVDPDDALGLAAERERLAALAEELVNRETPPSFVVDSGNGVQPVWLLARPLAVEHIEVLEAYCARLEAVLGAKGTFNADRLLRCPDSVNYPNKKN